MNSDLESVLFVRRCHVCGTFNESSEDILKCFSCRKSLLPFYYFDKRKLAEFSDDKERPMDGLDRKTGYGPIRGLTAFW
jgi:hypothetical protein